jgi:hypothetical protein
MMGTRYNSPYGMSLTFKPPPHDDPQTLIYFRYGIAEVDSSGACPLPDGERAHASEVSVCSSPEPWVA